MSRATARAGINVVLVTHATTFVEDAAAQARRKRARRACAGAGRQQPQVVH
ncbi:uncharacterized protein COLE_01790 [Cutaneotrichosporon oleaginosum]|nr:hypothetical protein COLE_01790 [Cutaneotrichosporon oleaginosum]